MPKQHFHHICLTEEDIYWTLCQIYTTQIQNQPYPHANLSLLSDICFTASLLQSAIEDIKRLLLQIGPP